MGSGAVLEVSRPSSVVCHLSASLRMTEMLSKHCLIRDQEMVNDYMASLLKMLSLKINL